MADPVFLIPALAALLLVVIWTSTIELVRLARADVARAAAVSSRELLDTYEAQVVRALREINQTLNLVAYWHEAGRDRGSLAALKERGLLPPELLFTVSIANRDGAVVESTRPQAPPSVADEDYFRDQRDTPSFFIGRPHDRSAAAMEMHFSRRLSAADHAFDGVVIVAVPADYFVSGYDPTKLGEHGALGMVGSLDGVVRIRRTGDREFAGDHIDLAIPSGDADDAAPSVSSWDGTKRWSSAREIYGFPVTIFVGLSVEEQLAAVDRGARTYWWRAAGGSLVIVAFAAILSRMSWKLAQSHLRESEARLAHAERIEYLAYHDGLTGLPNRSMFSKLLAQSLHEGQRHGRNLAVAFLDLDRFKQINDTLGHEAGDQLLKEVAGRLRASVRDSDTVARLGGDEFVILLRDLPDPKNAAVVAAKILAIIANPFSLIGQEFRVTASIGISTFPQDGLDEQTLTKNADIAMYQAKADGKNNFQFYSERLNANSLERLTLESSLRRALEQQQFKLCYQAKRDIRSGRIMGMEVLLRWQHPDLGLVPPMQFIPLAEETGLIVPIGRWVLKSACAQNMAWQKLGVMPLSIAVNLTERQFFDERLIDDVRETLRTTGMPARLLEFEISERLLIRDVDATLRTLGGLRQAGVRIAIDDFGTGYSSLASLQRFPLDTIKIDRSLVRSLSADSAAGTFTEAVIAMGKNLSLTIVAQGVETSRQAQHLSSQNCDQLQGFYFDKPLPPEEFERLLASREVVRMPAGTPADEDEVS